MVWLEPPRVRIATIQSTHRGTIYLKKSSIYLASPEARDMHHILHLGQIRPLYEPQKLCILLASLLQRKSKNE